MPDDRLTALTPNSYVSLGLVVSLIVGALFYGKQLQRLDGIEEELRELRVEVREMRRAIPQSIGR